MPIVNRSLVAVASKRKILGLYFFSMPLLTIPAGAQNGTTTGFAWLAALDVTKHARLRRLRLVFGADGLTATVTAPRVVLARFTITSGVNSGGEVTPGKRLTADAAPAAKIYSASATWVLALAEGIWNTASPPVLTGVGTLAGPPHEYAPMNEDEYLDLAPGEGAVVYLADAGSGTTRRAALCGLWDEYVPADAVEDTIQLPTDAGNSGPLSSVIAETQ